MSYISVPSLAHEVILKRLKRLGDPVPPGALEARSGIRGLSLATLDSFELSVSPVRPTVRTISRLGGRRQLAALLEPQTRRRALGPRRVVGTTGLGGVVIRGLGSVGSVGSKGRRASAARLGRSPAHGLGLAGAGSRRRRILPGRRHLPGRHLSSSVDRCGRPPSTPLPSPHHHQSEEGPPPERACEPCSLPRSLPRCRSRRAQPVRAGRLPWRSFNMMAAPAKL